MKLAPHDLVHANLCNIGEQLDRCIAYMMEEKDYDVISALIALQKLVIAVDTDIVSR